MVFGAGPAAAEPAWRGRNRNTGAFRRCIENICTQYGERIILPDGRECRRRNRLTLRSRLCGRQSFLLKEPVFAVREKDGTVCQGIFGIQRFRRIAKSHVHDAAALFSELRNRLRGLFSMCGSPRRGKAKSGADFPQAQFKQIRCVSHSRSIGTFWPELLRMVSGILCIEVRPGCSIQRRPVRPNSIPFHFADC